MSFNLPCILNGASSMFFFLIDIDQSHTDLTIWPSKSSNERKLLLVNARFQISIVKSQRWEESNCRVDQVLVVQECEWVTLSDQSKGVKMS